MKTKQFFFLPLMLIGTSAMAQTIASLSNQGMCSCGEDFELTLTLDNCTSEKISAPYVLSFLDDEDNELGNIDLDVLNFEPYETGVRVVVTNPYDLDCLMSSGVQLKAELVNADCGLPEDACTLTLCSNLNISYTLTDAEWGTICLPYDAELPADVKAYNVTDLNGTSLVLSEATKLEMNKAYLLHGEPDTYQFHGPDTPQGIYQNGLLWGATKTAGDYVPKGSYVLQNNPDTGLAFYQVTKNYYYKIKKYTAYLKAEIPAGARIFIDEETGIQNMEIDEAEAAEIFNILGQRTASAKGLVIKNGKLNYVK